jgi:hypothetical protein
MRSLSRSVGMALAAAGCTAGLALTTATAADAANVVLMVNGLGAGNLTDLAMSSILGGMYGGTNYVRQNVPWPQQARPVTGWNSMTLSQSINIGANNLDAALDSALLQLKPGERVTIVGLSAGALVADEELRRLTTDPTAPDKSKLEFVVIADSSRILFNRNRYDAVLGYTYRPPVDSKYDTKAVVAEYDGYADYPDRPTNTLAVQNAMAGANIVHVPSMVTPLSSVPASNIKRTTNSLGGVTTSYLIPTTTLPLVIANPALKPQEAQLKAIIDSAYIRNDKTTAAASTTVSATTAAVVEEQELDVTAVSVSEPVSVPAAQANSSDDSDDRASAPRRSRSGSRGASS